ncbi:type II methionyl aminopeptidase [archaeon]|nr:type II methionyl aminopeptidase [archaeon]
MDEWLEAGRIAKEALEYGKSLIEKGAVMREVCEKTDQKIIQLGAKPAWPTQIGNNYVAAHYTPDFEDNGVFNDELVCLDVGANLNGCIGDNACTVDLSGKYEKLINSAKEALNEAIKMCIPGMRTGEIGGKIQEVINKHGFSPVRNLSGHGLNKWVIHDTPKIPNYDDGSKIKLVEGQIIAIEPFATTGTGLVEEAGQTNIFALENSKPVRTPFAREILQFVENNYKNLPFTTRWLIQKFGKGKTSLALRELTQKGILTQHPPLVEKTKGMVAVWEHTILVGKEPKVLTK